MFIGENLTNLRIMHGYSRKQLSEMLNLTEQAIWQYENNYTSPKLQIVNQLKSIFHVKSKYFYNKDVLERYFTAGNIPVMNIAYRSKVLNVISTTQTEAKHIEYLDSFVNYITYNLTLPIPQIIQLRNDIIDYLNHSSDNRSNQINKIAMMTRERLGFDHHTNDNLMFLVEKSGVFIFEKPIGEEIDAYSLWTNQDRPFIMLGNLKRSAVRRNFDLAHELGHLLLHYKVEFTNLNTKEHKVLENEANQFAGALLLPEQEILDDLNTIAYPTNPEAYIDLKEKWKTSLQVLGYRAVNLGVLDAKKHRNFYAALHRKGYLKREPLDDVIPIQKPQKIKSIFDLLIKQGIVRMNEMLEKDWLIEVDFLYHLTGLKVDFFNQYTTKTQDFDLIELNSPLSKVQQ